MSDLESETSEVGDGAQNSRAKAALKRCHFSSFETTRLLSLIEENKKVIEAKNTSFMTQDKKRKAWAKLVKDFNSSPDVTKRSLDQLQKKWDNLKSRAKKDVTAHHKTVRKTGGGSPPPDISDVSEKVVSIVPSQMRSLDNDFDSDNFLKPRIPETTTGILEDDTAGVDEPGEKDGEEPKPKKRAKNRDARSALVDWEYEEHKMRLKTLALSHEAEQLRVEKMKMEVGFMKDKHELEKDLLVAQINHYNSNHTIVLGHSINNE